MDPCSAIGVASAAIQIITTIGSTVKGLAEIRNKVIAADQSIRSLVSQLSSIKSALSIIHDWTENDLVVSPTQSNFVDALSAAIDGCSETMDALSEEVAKLVGSAAAENIGFRTRTRFVWNESSMKDHQDRLQSQVAALQFLVVAVKCRSPQERTGLLHDVANQRIIQKVVDDTSTLRASRSASTENSQATPTIVSHSNSTIDTRSYAVDPMVVNTRAYRRVEEYRRTLAHNRSMSYTQHPQNEQIDKEGENESSEEATQPDEHFSPTWVSPDRYQQKRPLYQATVVSDPGSSHRVQYNNPKNHDTRPDPVTTGSPGVFVGEKARAMHKKASRFLFRRGSKEHNPKSSDSFGASDLRLESRRGRRGFEDNFQQSIDFSLPNSLTAPPLVRAAQAGSIVEVEQLLDRGADIEACHVSSGRCALAVAAHCGNNSVLNLLLSQGARTDSQDASRSTPLHLAASRGHTGAMKLLIEYGAVIEEKDAEGRTPLWLAASTGHIEAVELLLSKRAKVNARADAQLTALHVAAKRGDAAMIQLLLRHGAHIDGKDGHFMSALHYACESGHESAVNILLGRHANIEAPGKDSQTPLICAAATGQLHVIELLLKRKANPKSQADGKMNALHWACRNGHESAVSFLLAKRLPINAVNSDGKSALHLAVISKKFDVVELLLRLKADREIRCQRSYTALHYACSVGTLDIVKILLGYGAHVESTTIENGRPLHIAVTRGACDIVEELLAKGADYNSRDIREDRALCIACSQGDIAIVETLLNAGTPLRLRFSDKAKSREDSPLCVAARYGHLEICSMLISKGASVRQKDELLWQPLRYAAYYGHPKVVQLLLTHGAEVSSTGASGGWGFDVTASRIGFATNADISQERKTLITSLLRNAEDREALEREREADAQAMPRSGNEKGIGPSELMGGAISIPELTAPAASRAPSPPLAIVQSPQQQARPIKHSATLLPASLVSSFIDPHNEASQQAGGAQRSLDTPSNLIYELDSAGPEERSSNPTRGSERTLSRDPNVEAVVQYLKDNSLERNLDLEWPLL